MKTLDFKNSVYDLVHAYPDVRDVLADLGFKDITNPMMLNTFGKKMTIPKGAKVKGIDMNAVIAKFNENGFAVINAFPSKESMERQAEIKSLLKRLHDGESMESVQAEFKQKFSDVSSREIAEAEQGLILEGVNPREVQKLCDVHSVMFHGAIREEEEAPELKDIKGHPLYIMWKENDAIEALAKEIRKVELVPENVDHLKDLLKKMKGLKQHYGKKEELYFRKLEKYGISGPTTVMWGVDDEIYANISGMERTVNAENISSLSDKLNKTLDRLEEMIFKEENILFPMAAENFTDEEWAEVYHDMDEMGYCLITDVPRWENAPEWHNPNEISSSETIIHMPTGSFNAAQLEGILRTMPMDITFVDDQDIVRFFTNGKERIFPRPMSALGKELWGCHSPKTVPMIRKLISDFREHKRTSYERIINKENFLVLVRYYAIYDPDGKYLGTLETSQNLFPYKKELSR